MNNFVPRSALAIFDLPESHRQGYPPDADVPLSISLPDDCRRVLMISRPGLVSDCLLRMLNAFGLETAQQSLGDPLNDQFDTVALAILWISHVDADILAAARQRVEELRTRLPQVRVMALVDGIERAAIPELSMLGITAIVVGSPSIRVAVAAIQFVMVGGPLVNAEIHLGVEQAIAACGHAGPCDGGGDFTPPEQNCRFTEREAAVLQRLRQGQPNKIIAHGLGISESTVKAHLRSIMAKLKVTNRTQIVCLLASHGEPEHAEL